MKLFRSGRTVGKEFENCRIELDPIERRRGVLGGQLAIEQSLQELICDRNLRAHHHFSKQMQGIENKNNQELPAHRLALLLDWAGEPPASSRAMHAAALNFLNSRDSSVFFFFLERTIKKKRPETSKKLLEPVCVFFWVGGFLP